MTTPRLTAKGQATRDRIVTAAAELMFERGVAGTSTEDVQAAAGVSTSQIYHYFRDKKALVRAVIALQTEMIVGNQEAVLATLDSVASLRAWADAIVELQRSLGCKGGCPIGSLGTEIAEHDPDARADVAAGFERWERAIRGGLHTMRDRGELRREADPDRLATTLLATLQGGLALTQVRRDTVVLEIALAQVIDHIETFTS
ncbi:TetR/AcrR family transcriptional regulator [Kutzneria sp. CA-103260]|uniref:TetR/AcrR family transcriptional regulator n=1 Tax=Kutzneria sp. CA-103260 TaxID=2802641 RepID=UPI001BA50F77|nr:TetR/AcrR family transcriptional regulator [Kutzneria sp. CA-103260]QUQ62524.1 transcriptional regulator [Kutzneria sp. CA-103260]